MAVCLCVCSYAQKKNIKNIKSIKSHTYLTLYTSFFNNMSKVDEYYASYYPDYNKTVIPMIGMKVGLTLPLITKKLYFSGNFSFANGFCLDKKGYIKSQYKNLSAFRITAAVEYPVYENGKIGRFALNSGVLFDQSYFV